MSDERDITIAAIASNSSTCEGLDAAYQVLPAGSITYSFGVPGGLVCAGPGQPDYCTGPLPDYPANRTPAWISTTPDAMINEFHVRVSAIEAREEYVSKGAVHEARRTLSMLAKIFKETYETVVRETDELRRVEKELDAFYQVQALVRDRVVQAEGRRSAVLWERNGYVHGHEVRVESKPLTMKHAAMHLLRKHPHGLRLGEITQQLREQGWMGSSRNPDAAVAMMFKRNGSTFRRRDGKWYLKSAKAVEKTEQKRA